VPAQDRTLDDLLPDLLEAAGAAGRMILSIYRSGTTARIKSDSSPVTDADEAAETIILAALERLTPDIPIIAEERVAAGRIPAVGPVFWLVDPLDGTKEFISGNGEFTVNIALVRNGEPILGIVLAPAIGRMFWGIRSKGAFERAWNETETASTVGRPLHVRCVPDVGLTVVASRSHRDPETEQLIAGLRVADFKAAGSSLKFCLVAGGEADYYPRTGRTMEWDTAAGHAVLAAAGGSVTRLDGTPFLYGKPDFSNPGFIACGGPLPRSG